MISYREAGRALKVLEVESPCDPGSWDSRQVAIWMESHSVSLCVVLPCTSVTFPPLQNLLFNVQYIYVLLTNL